MTEENTKISCIGNNKVLIIAVAVAVLVSIFMYFHDQKQQRALELRRLEKRAELLEEWGVPRQNLQSNTPSPRVRGRGGKNL